MLVLVEFCRTLARGNFDCGDFRGELAAGLSCGKRFCERSAQRSCSSRVIWCEAARSSVCHPECLPEKASLRPSISIESKICASPMRYPPVSYTHLRAHETRHDLV